jgi:NADH-quinone oxidoreductase subunit H
MSVMQVIATLLKVLVMIGFTMNMAAILTWMDRRQGAVIQDRIGPNRAVIKIFGKEIRLAGLLHPAADGVKFFTKEDFMPPKADKLLFAIAPILAVGAVVALLVAIPFTDTICPNQIMRTVVKDGQSATWWPAVARYGVCGTDHGVAPIDGAIAPLNVGILYVFAIAGQGIIGAAIAGWASDNKFSLMGALRASSQMVSYEVTLGMSLIGAMMVYGTVRLDDMVRWQGEHTWGIFVQPIAFFLFFAAAVAEAKRIPFDLPEAESELVSGYFTEYSGMKFGMFYLGEYMEVVTSSMLIVVIFLGGWELPFLHRDGLTIEFGASTVVHLAIPHIWMIVLNVLAFFGKVIFICWFQTFVRWSLPRFRYDQLMRLGWKVLLPASLANILVTGVVYLALDRAGPAASDGLKLAADITQLILAIAITYFFVRIVVGFFGRREKLPFIVGSAAAQAAEAGGTKASPMQA